jgi:glycosyltransferase involved in cell wall biosynthesis
MARLFSEVGAKVGRNVVAIQYGVDLAGSERRAEARERRGIVGSTVAVGYVGRVSHEKGIEDLCRIFLDLAPRFADSVFVAIGDGPMMSSLYAVREKLGARRMILPGFSPDARSLISALDVIVMPSRREGLSIAHLEAMSHAKPVAAYAIEGLTEAGADGVTGLYVTPGEPRLLAAAVEKLILNPGMRSIMGSAGREKVVRDFSLDRMTRQFETLYSQL